VGDRTIAPGTDAYRSALAAPLCRWGDSLRMVFFISGVTVELAFESVDGTAVLTVTAVNGWTADVPVALRLALGWRTEGIGSTDTGRLWHETNLAPPAFSEIAGYDGPEQSLSCTLPDQPSKVSIVSNADLAARSAWDFPIIPSLNLTGDKGVLLFWPAKDLAPNEFIRVRVLLAPGEAGAVALSQNDIHLRNFSVSPSSDFELRTRKISLEVGNSGPAADLDAMVLFALEGAPLAIRFLPIRVEWNRTAHAGFDWLPPEAGNYTVHVMLPFFNDRDPADNLRSRAADVRVNPYRYILKFSSGDVRDDYRTYAGAKFKVQVYVYNSGFAPDTIRISVEGVPDHWTALLSSNTASLEPNRIAYIWLSVQPSYVAGNGTYGFNIFGTSQSSGEVQVLLMVVEIVPPPPPASGHAAPSQNLVLGNGSVPPATTLRPYAAPDRSPATWFSGGDRGRTAFAVLGGLGIAVAVIIFGVAIYQASNLRTINVMRRIIKRALYGLTTGDEYRQTVFAAYKKMCSHLERYGFSREEHVTPREFARALKLALPLDTRSIRMLTGLFEEARYSNHKIGPGDRKAAIDGLIHIERELDQLTTFEEQPSRWTRLRKRMGLGEA